MTNKMFYPAVFHEAEEGGFWISFPDLPEVITEGDDMNEAYAMAQDCLGLVLTSYENEKNEFPKPSLPNSIPVQKNEFLVIVEFDMLEYKKKINSKAVKKTLTIPGWLNEEAMKKDLNFSQILQEALIIKLKSL